MALSRICSSEMLNILTCMSRRAPMFLEMYTTTVYLSTKHHYPDPPTLAQPTNNVCNILKNDIRCFGSDRTRDIPLCSDIAMVKSSGFTEICNDKHVDMYDRFGTNKLNSAMWNNLPEPYSSHGMSMHLDMPVEQWSHDKYIVKDTQRSHCRKLSCRFTAINLVITSPLLRATYWSTHDVRMKYSTDASKVPNDSMKEKTAAKTAVTMSQRDKFRLMLRDYGGTLLFVHINISLMCLGICYMVVISGVDVMPLVMKMTGGNEQFDNLMKTSTDFILAYTVHKLLAPVRISASLAVTPILVRRLRKFGILKMPKIKQQSQSRSSSSSTQSS